MPARNAARARLLPAMRLKRVQSALEARSYRGAVGAVLCWDSIREMAHHAEAEQAGAEQRPRDRLAHCHLRRVWRPGGVDPGH
jgi:hypothetical protein